MAADCTPPVRALSPPLLLKTVGHRRDAADSRISQPPGRSPLHDHLAQIVARQEKFHRIELAEQFFQISVIEYLPCRAHATLGNLYRPVVDNPESVRRRLCSSLTRCEKRQQ